jgi:hypothetical protein
MSESRRISHLLLERYNLGEVTPEEEQEIGAALAADSVLALRLEELRRSDREIRAAQSALRLIPEIRKKAAPRRFTLPVLWGLCAAALLFIAVLPFTRSPWMWPADDRAKGSTELSVYLKDNEDTKLADYAILHAGNTVQLAYTVQSGAYGVIFSIDGRSAVTLHYPYSTQQSTRLFSGKRILLDEAYTLDDAPDFEIFFFVIGDMPLDVQEILRSAEVLARNPKTAVDQSVPVFRDYELKTITLRKE